MTDRMLLMALCASTMHERAWPHCLRLDTLGFYESMRSSNKRRCLLTRCSATTTVISSKSAQSTASYTIVAGVSLFLHRGLLYWARGEASRKAYQMKRETEAAIELQQRLPRTATRRDNVKTNGHSHSGISRAQWLRRFNGMSQTTLMYQ